MIGRTISHYEIVDRLGRGGMGVVYKAHDSKLLRFVALKFLPPEATTDVEARTRFLREARAVSALEHPNICVVHEIGETDDGEMFMVMPHYEGESLMQMLQRGPLDPHTAARIALQVATGLAKAHREGVFHRDIKPGNILITTEGQVKILDFGLAKLARGSRLTREGTMMGTVAYMAPEQVCGRNVDARADLWGLGAVLFEAIAGRPPFHADNESAIAYRIVNEPPDLERLTTRAPSALVKIGAACLQKDPQKRFQCAEDVAQALARYLGVTTAPLTPATTASVPAAAPVSGDDRTIAYEDPSDLLQHLPAATAREQRGVFVARERELERLERSLELVVGGQGQVTLICGEAGQGKTALVVELTHRAESLHSDLLILSGKCNAQTRGADPYLPFRQVLGMLTGDFAAAGVSDLLSHGQAARIGGSMPRTLHQLLEVAPDLVNSLLPLAPLLKRTRALFPSAGELLAALEHKGTVGAGEVGQHDLGDQFTRLLNELASEQPMMIVLDDLQWTDSASASLLANLGSELRASRVMLIGLYRNEDLRAGAGEDHHPLESALNTLKRERGDIELNLDEVDGRAFVDAFLDAQSNALGEEFREALYRQTRGVPLFTAEIVETLRERGFLIQDETEGWLATPKLDWGELPARVDAAVAERIDRLPEELISILTVASVEGEEFSAEVAAAVLQQEPRQVASLLSRELAKKHRLVRARGLKRIAGGRRLSRYEFRNRLYQQHLYDRLDAVERSYVHEDVATALVELFGEETGEVAVQLARHYLEADISDRAVTYLYQAGQQALFMSANTDAIGLFENALKTLAKLKDDPKRDQQEFEILVALAPALIATRGFNSPEVERVYSRARELSEALRELPGFRVLWGLFAFHSMRAKWQEASALAGQMLQRAEAEPSPALMVQGHYVCGVSSFYRGALGDARTAFEAALGIHARDIGLELSLAFAQDSRRMAEGYLGMTLWLQGFPDQGLERCRQAVSAARRQDHPFTLTTALLFLGFVRLFRREPEEVPAIAGEIISISREHSLYEVREGEILLGCAQAVGAAAGPETEAAAASVDLQERIADCRTSGSMVLLPFYMAHQIAACTRQGRAERASDLAQEALELASASGELFWAAELHRLSGEALLAGPTGPATDPARRSQAEKLYRQALETAREQGARSLELRAALSLADLLHADGRPAAARELVESFSREFSEGLETRDLLAAKSLLTELG